MKYFAIFDKNVATIFQLQWNIGNIPDIFLQYSVLCGLRMWESMLFWFNFFSYRSVEILFESNFWFGTQPWHRLSMGTFITSGMTVSSWGTHIARIPSSAQMPNQPNQPDGRAFRYIRDKRIGIMFIDGSRQTNIHSVMQILCMCADICIYSSRL